MRTEAPSLAPILRSATQGRLLAILAANPGRSYGIRELAEAAATSPTTAQREIDRAETAGIVTSRYEGRNRRVRMNPAHYLYQAVRQILLATYGAAHVITEEFSDLDADRVLLFGSWVARYEGHDGRPPNDIDVLIIGNNVDRLAVDQAADRAERRIGLPVQATIRSRNAWHQADDAFLATVKSRPHLTLLTNDDDTGNP
jgi:DNA-binding transcriptional ArsR family regulator